MASPAPPEPAEQGCPAPAAAEQAPPPPPPPPPPPLPRAPREEQEGEAQEEGAVAGAGRQVEEAAGGVAAAVTWLLGEPVLWLGCRADEILSWKRPLRSLLAFVGANLLFWCAVWKTVVFLAEEQREYTGMFCEKPLINSDEDACAGQGTILLDLTNHVDITVHSCGEASVKDLILEPEQRAVVGEEKGSPKSRNSAETFPKANQAVGSENPGLRLSSHLEEKRGGAGDERIRIHITSCAYEKWKSEENVGGWVFSLEPGPPAVVTDGRAGLGRRGALCTTHDDLGERSFTRPQTSGDLIRRVVEYLRSNNIYFRKGYGSTQDDRSDNGYSMDRTGRHRTYDNTEDIQYVQAIHSLDGGLYHGWEVINSKPDERPRLSHCLAESWVNFSIFLQEMSLFKQQSPGKAILCAFLCPFFKCNDIGQKIYNKIKSFLLKLDFGIREYINQKKRERAEADKEKSHKDDSELDFSALCPKISLTVAAKELSVSDTDVSEVSWTDNGTFNLSEGYTPQTDTSDDLDRPSEEVFSRDLSDFPSLENGTGTNDEDELSLGLPTELKRRKEQLDRGPRPSSERQSVAGLTLPLSGDQTFHLMSNLAGDVITAAVTAAVKDQLAGMQQALSQAAPSPGEDTDMEEGDDFELLDQSELDQIESELGLSQDQEAEAPQNKKSSGFLSNLLGGH
ncbi:hypothetical protein EI555_007555 [Monodon monoceros]|uniref:RETREG1-3/ARL6IP-like N-terminal reticulon-homology domain-containing protein n=1 Tax=Monodon monoceros TaxID=40151 RepID=A0A4U1FSC5_MONMO|nr:hypothetical protein EI555_007555 [Monodon monoceros]